VGPGRSGKYADVSAKALGTWSARGIHGAGLLEFARYDSCMPARVMAYPARYLNMTLSNIRPSITPWAARPWNAESKTGTSFRDTCAISLRLVATTRQNSTLLALAYL